MEEHAYYMGFFKLTESLFVLNHCITLIGQMNRNHNFEDHSREKVNFLDDICIVA